jgi:hypothetical protein
MVMVILEAKLPIQVALIRDQSQLLLAILTEIIG